MVTSATDLSLRYDPDSDSTFDVLAGKAPLPQRRFTVHHNLFTQRSEFFRAARSSQWLTDPTKPVDLEDDDPEIVSKYLSCVYFGAAALRTDVEDQEPPRRTYPDEREEDDDPEDAFAWPQKELEKSKARLGLDPTPYDIACDAQHLFLAKIWLQADKLQDPTTANLVADEIIRFSQAMRRNPSFMITNHAYELTMHGSPLRKLMRDFRVHKTCSTAYLALHAFKFQEDVYRDIAVESLRIQGLRPSMCQKPPGFPQILCADSGAYHFHSVAGPRRARSCACARRPSAGGRRFAPRLEDQEDEDDRLQY
jgi:hypothetical protein